MTDRERLIRLVRADRAAGMSRPAIARKHGVTRHFVEYHTSVSALRHGAARPKREPTVDVECAVCQAPARVTVGALRKRRKRGALPYTCRFCARRREPESDELNDYEIRLWAWRQVKHMSAPERQIIGAALDRIALEPKDDSRFALHRRRRERMSWYEGLRGNGMLEKPFGERAA